MLEIAYLYFAVCPVVENCGDMGQGPGDVIGMLWEKAGDDPAIAGDGVANWRLVAGDWAGRPAGDWARPWGATGDGWSRAESWEAVI